MKRASVAVFGVSLVLVGCDALFGEPDAGSEPIIDVGSAPPDASVEDAGLDAGQDAGVDAGLDGGHDAGLDGGADIPDPCFSQLSGEARAHFELTLRRAFGEQPGGGRCTDCHNAVYGAAHEINFLQTDASRVDYDRILAYRTRERHDPLINTFDPEANMPFGSILFTRGVHGPSGSGVPFPTSFLAAAAEWVRLERNACRERESLGCEPGCIPVSDAGIQDAGIFISPRDRARIAFEANIAPMISARGCATCHSGAPPIGPNWMHIDLNIAAEPNVYDSVLAYRLANFVPALFDFNDVPRSLILRKGQHFGGAASALALDIYDRADVIAWLELERLAACDEGTWDCGTTTTDPVDAGDAGPPDAGDAGPDDAGGPMLSPTERSRAYYYANVAPVMAEQCRFCHSGAFAAENQVAYLDHNGPEYESFTTYIAVDFRSLFDLENPEQSYTLTKGPPHIGPRYGREGSFDQDRENFITWVLIEREAQAEIVVDAGPRPDAARPDTAMPPPDDAGPGDDGDAAAPTPRELARAHFETHIRPRLSSRSCFFCHGSMPAQATPPINWAALDGQPAYESILAWRTAGGYPLLNFEFPSASLLMIKPAHANNIAPPYLGPSSADAMARFLEWVALERNAALAEGTYAPPIPDAGTPDTGIPDAGPSDASGPSDACHADASELAASARELFNDNVYRFLIQPAATCDGCHIVGGRPTPFMIRPTPSNDRNNAALADERYEFIRNNPNMVNRVIPSTSLLLLKDENHEGGQGLLSLGATERGFLDWVAAENAATAGATCSTSSSSGGTCETPFAPVTPPAGAPYPELNAIDLRAQLCRPDLAGAAASVYASRFGSGLEMSNLTVTTAPGQALRVRDPLLTRWTRTITSDGGVRYFPIEVFHPNAAFSQVIPGGTTVTVVGNQGVIMAGFYDGGALTHYLSIEFSEIAPAGTTVDAGVADAGPLMLLPCNQLTRFETEVRPRLSAPSMNMGASCTTCHAGGTGYERSTAAMDLRQLQTNSAAACMQVKRWVNPGAPATSRVLQNVDPANLSHFWKFSTTDEFSVFRNALVPWIQSEGM